MYKRFFTEQTLEETLSQCFRVEALYRETIAMSSGAEKLTLVARARRVG